MIGPSGCGKSTMFNIIAGLELPTSGNVLVDGKSAIGEREHTAYMPQKDLLFPWRTVQENAALGLEVRGLDPEVKKAAQLKAREVFAREAPAKGKKAARELARATFDRETGGGSKKAARAKAGALFEQLGLRGFETSYPFELSGGMRQRAALLRTVVQGREILLLDEPFGALDSLTRSEMQNWLQGMWSENSWTAVMITHDIREAVYLADRVIVLTARPASVRLNLEVNLPRPRELSITTSPEFAAIEEQLIDVLHEESRKAFLAQRGITTS